MKNFQKGFANILLILIIIFLIGIVGYFVLIKKPIVDNQQVKNTNNNLPVSDSLQKNNFTNISWKTYSNPEFGFQIKYPIGTQIKDVDIVGGRAVFFNLPQSVPGLEISPFIEITVQNQEYGKGGKFVTAQCNFEGRPSTKISYNGVDFIKTDISSDFGGMQTAVIAQSYCVINNGIEYSIITRISYGRDSIVPDKNSYFKKFDQLVGKLEFKTI